MDADRRQGSTLRFEPAEGVLVVGGRTAVLDGAPAPDLVVGTYVELVFSQRAVQPHSHEDLRNRELVQLADLLQLPPAELDALIDRELERLLGQVVGADPGQNRAWRRLVFAALLGAAAAGGVVWAISADSDVSASTDAGDAGEESSEPAPPPTEATLPAAEATPVEVPAEAPAPPVAETPAAEAPAADDGSTVEIVELPDGGTATRTESAPAPPSEGVDIGTAVVYERNEAPPAP